MYINLQLIAFVEYFRQMTHLKSLYQLKLQSNTIQHLRLWYLRSNCRSTMNHLHFIVVACNFAMLIHHSFGTKYCPEILQDKHIKHINWSYLKQCVAIANGEGITKDMGENIWRLTKIVSTFDLQLKHQIITQALLGI